MSNWEDLYESGEPFHSRWIGENAPTYADAIKRAGELRSEGYDLFRGQAECHDLVPNARRRGKSEVEKTLTQFAKFVASEPLLKPLLASSDSRMAVAQHYGLPTAFLDFSTDPEVAGYFAQHKTATDAKEADRLLKPSCIICGKSDKVGALLSAYDRLEEQGLFRFIEPKGLNAFQRIAAQRGVFIRTAFAGSDIDVAVDFHRIFFPPVTGKSKLKKRDVFPPRCTPEERLLDAYFDRDR